MTSPVTVRAARVDDAAEMARVLVRSWRETYRGLMRDEVLDDPRLAEFRERFWTVALSDERDREIIGVALAGPPERPEPGWATHLYVLYVVAAEHGSGAGAALLDAVVDPREPAALWVADPNPRAQAFYRKHGFEPDGAVQVDDGVREIRMVRAAGRAGPMGQAKQPS